MSYGKDESKGKSSPSHSPAPLPMYQRVVLKHVPTMVRRRYDSDLDSLIQNLPSEDSNSEGDGVEDAPPAFAANDADDGADDKVEEDGAQTEEATIGNCNTNQDTQTCAEDFRRSAGMHMEDEKSEVEGPEDEILASSMEAIDENRNQFNGPEKCDIVLDDEAEHAHFANYVDKSAITEVQNREHGSDVEDNGWDGNGSKAANIVCHSVDDVEDDMEVGYSENNQGSIVENCESEGDGIIDANISGYSINDSDEDENKYKENGDYDVQQGAVLEDSKNHKEEASYGDASVNMNVQDEGLETKQVIVMENSAMMMDFGKNATKGYHSPAPLPMYQRVTLNHVPTIVRRRYDKALDKFDASEDLPSEDSNSEDDGVEDATPAFASNDVHDGADDKVEEDGAQLEDATIGKCNTNQNTQTCTKDFRRNASMHMEDEKSEVDLPEDANLASSMEVVDENEKQINGPEKCDNAQGSDVEDNRWDGNETKAANIVSYSVDDVENNLEVRHSNNEQGLIVENCKSELDGIKDVIVVGYRMNDNDEDENKDKENGDCNGQQGALLEDSKNYKEVASYGDASVNMDVQDEGPETKPVTVTENSVTMMTLGKNATKGYHSPRPLPMYQRVTLNHVPTIVRRRYDKALDKFDASEGGASNDCRESEGDRAEYANPASTLCAMDDSTGLEAEDATKTRNELDTKHHAQTYTEEFCGKDFEPSASMYLEDGTSENYTAEEANLFSSGGNDGKNMIQVNGHDNFDSGMHSEDDKSEVEGAEEANLSSCVDDNGNDIIQVNGHEISDSDQVFYSEDGEIENDGGYEVNFSSSVDDNGNDKIQVNGLDKFDSEKGMDSDGKIEKDGAEEENIFSSVEVDGKDILEVNGLEKSDSDKGMYSDDGKNENDGGEEATLFRSVDDNMVDILQVNGHAKPDSNQGSEDGKSGNDGAEEMNFSSFVNDNGKDITQLNGHAKSYSDEASSSKDCTSEDDEAKDVNFTGSINARVEDGVLDKELDLKSYCVGDSAEDEVQGKKHRSSDNNHGFQIEHCESKGGGTDATTYYVDGNVKDEFRDKECVNCDRKCDLPIRDVETQGNGADDEYLDTATYGTEDHNRGRKNSYCEHDLNPEVLKKTLAQDGYDLCCPNCKRYITETIILRRKEKDQQCQTTCFSCLTVLFRCIQW